MTRYQFIVTSKHAENTNLIRQSKTSCCTVLYQRICNGDTEHPLAFYDLTLRKRFMEKCLHHNGREFFIVINNYINICMLETIC